MVFDFVSTDLKTKRNKLRGKRCRTRIDGRQPNELRQLSCSWGFKCANGQRLLRWGNYVLTSVTVEERVPSHRLASGSAG